MTEDPIYMKLDPTVSRFAIELFPHLKNMVEDDGCLYTQLLKAMYGCTHASALWYAEIKKELEKLGYSVSTTDRCVFRKRVGDRIYILLLYVDDILALVDEVEAENIRLRLTKRFGEIVFEIGKKLSYLGMEIEVTSMGTMVDMNFYIKQLLDGEAVVTYVSPGAKETFEVNPAAGLLSLEEKKWYHSASVRPKH